MTFEIKRATRTGVRPLIGLYSESGCGKTYSALLLARGFVGPQGKIGMLDTESGRGELYADVIPGGYDVLRMDAPFSPARYVEAMQALHKAGCGIIIVDSMSHEWEGIGGVLDMAGDNEQKSGRPGLHNWKTPKMEHAKMMGAMLQAPVPLIVCIRAKFKTRQVKDERGKTQIVKDDQTSPIQSEEFIFEMTAHGEIMPDHTLRLTKCSHPALRECFPERKMISVATGEALARWCNAPVQGAPAAQPEAPFSAPTEKPAPSPASTPPGPTVNQMKARLWKLRPNPEMTPAEFEQWLWDEGHLPDTENLSGLTAEGYASVLSRVEARRP